MLAAALLLTAAATIFFIYVSFFKKSAAANEESKLNYQSAFEFTKHGELTFISESIGFRSKIDIEIADDDNSRAQGLMYRTKMNENQGMFFIFPNETFQSFWMRNTVMPLDIIFVNKENRIVRIHKNTEPFYEGSYPSNAPAIYVIEVNAGYTEKYGINEGDKISWRRL